MIEDLNTQIKTITDIKTFLTDKLSKCERSLKKYMIENKNQLKAISENKQKINELHTIIERMKLQDESHKLEIKEMNEKIDYMQSKHREEINKLDFGIVEMNGKLNGYKETIESLKEDNLK